MRAAGFARNDVVVEVPLDAALQSAAERKWIAIPEARIRQSRLPCLGECFLGLADRIQRLDVVVGLDDPTGLIDQER